MEVLLVTQVPIDGKYTSDQRTFSVLYLEFTMNSGESSLFSFSHRFWFTCFVLFCFVFFIFSFYLFARPSLSKTLWVMMTFETGWSSWPSPDVLSVNVCFEIRQGCKKDKECGAKHTRLFMMNSSEHGSEEKERESGVEWGHLQFLLLLSFGEIWVKYQG